MTDHAFDTGKQQPCTHCGECARTCPEALDPEALFLALVKDDLGVAQGARLEACSECNRCVEVCPSHIPLLEWFRWGKSDLRERIRAEDARQRFLARNARLARERELRAMRRGNPSPIMPTAQTISRSEVLAAIARGKARRREKRP